MSKNVEKFSWEICWEIFLKKIMCDRISEYQTKKLHISGVPIDDMPTDMKYMKAR